jgi:hypothetical protein
LIAVHQRGGAGGDSPRRFPPPWSVEEIGRHDQTHQK